MPSRLRLTLLAAATAATLAGALEARAASDYLLKLDGIKGESTDDRHKEWIDVLSWSWGVAQVAGNGSGSGARAGKSCPSDLVLTKFVDSATPPLIAGAAGGTVIPNAILIGMKQGREQQEYLKIELKNVFVSSVHTGGSSGGSVPVDSVSLRFSSMTVSYYPQRADGSLGTPVVASLQGC